MLSELFLKTLFLMEVFQVLIFLLSYTLSLSLLLSLLMSSLRILMLNLVWMVYLLFPVFQSDKAHRGI